jgi:hypothetical protein
MSGGIGELPYRILNSDQRGRRGHLVGTDGPSIAHPTYLMPKEQKFRLTFFFRSYYIGCRLHKSRALPQYPQRG